MYLLPPLRREEGGAPLVLWRQTLRSHRARRLAGGVAKEGRVQRHRSAQHRTAISGGRPQNGNGNLEYGSMRNDARNAKHVFYQTKISCTQPHTPTRTNTHTLYRYLEHVCQVGEDDVNLLHQPPVVGGRGEGVRVGGGGGTIVRKQLHKLLPV